MKNFKIKITEPLLPNLNELLIHLKKMWKNGQVTNFGNYHFKFEKELKKKLNLKNLIIVNSGTTGLIVALKALKLKGEIITTPLTFAATTNAITNANCKPVFVDVNKHDFNINPNKIIEKITKNTSAILATHCYGIPCDIDAIKKISKKYNLKIIYDASHCFNIVYKNKNILSFGDASILSFNATKIFNTIEGGAISMSNKKYLQRAKELRYFGLNSNKILSDGINGKLNEVNSAIGILNLKKIDRHIINRKKIYKLMIKEIDENEYKIPEFLKKDNINTSYLPIIVLNNKRNQLYKRFLKEKIETKKYFYPPTNNSKYLMIKDDFPNANYLSSRVLCLPIHQNLNKQKINKILKILNSK